MRPPWEVITQGDEKTHVKDFDTDRALCGKEGRWRCSDNYDYCVTCLVLWRLAK
jgi:hypothetical protein